MRKKLPHSTCILLLYICTVVNAHVPTIEEILRTKQYILISQQDTATSMETDVPPGRCPQFMSRTLPGKVSYRYSGAHLVRDSFGRAPPMLMTIKDNEVSFNINIFTLNVSTIFHSDQRKHGVFMDKNGFSKFTNDAAAVKIKGKIKTTLFDSTSHMLYVDLSTPGNFEMEQYYVNKLNTAELHLTHLRKFYRSSPNSRFDWQEDPYTGKFYYKERIDDEISIFEIPMAALIPTIWDGEMGVKIGSVQEGTLMGATGGIFYTVNKKHDGNVSILSTSIVPSSLKAGLECKIKMESISDGPNFNKLIVVKNHDYCLLRDGIEYNKEGCEKEQRDYVSKMIQEDSTDTVKWLLVICIVLFMVIILLFVYIYWLRSTFISDLDRTHPNDYETEASLFVAKQRSFPSVYQDPALLDVSVDKWN